MSSSPAAPLPPDYTGVTNASRYASDQQYRTSQDQLDWAKQQYADNKPFTDQVRSKLMSSLDENTANARKDRARYETIYQPLEDRAVEDAKNWDSAGRMADNRGMAVANVASQFDVAGEAAKRSLESYGLDPSSTRYGALDLNTRLAKAAAGAGAANASDRQTIMEAQALRSGAINTGKGYPAQVQASYGTAGAAGTGANSAMNQTTGTFMPALGNGTAWSGLGNQSVGTWGSTLSNMYNSQIQGYSAGQQSSSGVGSALGAIGGIGMSAAMLMSDERVKENIHPIGTTDDGQPIIRFNYKGSDKTQIGLSAQETAKHHPEAVARGQDGLLRVDYKQAIPVPGEEHQRYAEGGAVPPPGALPSAIPPSASPSGGAQTDDVPVDIEGGGRGALNVGEFVTPKDVVRWLGESFLQKQILKARKDMQGATAKPEVRQGGIPTPQGAPPRQAIPAPV